MISISFTRLCPSIRHGITRMEVALFQQRMLLRYVKYNLTGNSSCSCLFCWRAYPVTSLSSWMAKYTTQPPTVFWPDIANKPEYLWFQYTDWGTRMSSTRQKINLCKSRNPKLPTIIWQSGTSAFLICVEQLFWKYYPPVGIFTNCREKGVVGKGIRKHWVDTYYSIQ